STVSLPLVLVVTYRTDADVTNVTAGLLAEIAREGQLLRLEGWTRDEIADFLGTRGIDAEDARVDRVAELTGGVPFLVEQVVDEGLHDSTGPLPEPARRLLDSRIALLDDRVRAVVEAAAVLGPGATPFEIAEVARVDQLTVQHAHDVAAVLGLV